MISFSHFSAAYLLAVFFSLNFFLAAAGGLLPDFDITFDSRFPFVHRGITHTPFLALVLTALILVVTNSFRDTYSFLAGWISHLTLDTLTPTGIMWLYPVSLKYYSLDIVYAVDFWANLIFAAVGFLEWWKYERR